MEYTWLTWEHPVVPGSGWESRGRGGAGIAWGGGAGLVPAAVDQNFSAFAPEHHGLGSGPGLAGDHDLSSSGCRDQTPYRVQPEVRGKRWKEGENPAVTRGIKTVPLCP